MAKLKTLSLVTPAAQSPRTLTVQGKVPESIRDAICKFEKEIGGRQALIEVLSTGDSDPSVQKVLYALADPQWDSTSLARVCQQEGITPGELFGAFETAAKRQGQILGALTAAKAAPAIVSEIVRVATPHEEPCETCNGVGQVTPEPTKKQPNPSPRPCDTCNGLGLLKKPASLDHQEKALEIAGLLKPVGGVQVLQQQNTLHVGQAASGSLEQLQQAVGAILFRTPAPPTSLPEPEVVDADPVDPA